MPYIINEKTILIEPAKAIDVASYVHESNSKYAVSKTPHELINYACIIYWSTYEGRRNATMSQTYFKRLVPIPINPAKKIIAIPTHSPNNYNNHWIFLSHVSHITDQTIYFKNNFSHTFKDISNYQLNKQLERATHLYFMLQNK